MYNTSHKDSMKYWCSSPYLSQSAFDSFPFSFRLSIHCEWMPNLGRRLLFLLKVFCIVANAIIFIEIRFHSFLFSFFFLAIYAKASFSSWALCCWIGCNGVSVLGWCLCEKAHCVSVCVCVILLRHWQICGVWTARVCIINTRSINTYTEEICERKMYLCAFHRNLSKAKKYDRRQRMEENCQTHKS